MPTTIIPKTANLWNMGAVATLILLANIGVVHAQVGPKAITSKTTVAEFALECQRPAMKSHSEERLNLCLTFLSGSVHQIALAKQSPKCWQEVEAGIVSPIVLSDALFFLATRPEDRGRPVGEALREVVTEVAAKACK